MSVNIYNSIHFHPLNSENEIYSSGSQKDQTLNSSDKCIQAQNDKLSLIRDLTGAHLTLKSVIHIHGIEKVAGDKEIVNQLFKKYLTKYTYGNQPLTDIEDYVKQQKQYHFYSQKKWSNFEVATILMQVNPFLSEILKVKNITISEENLEEIQQQFTQKKDFADFQISYLNTLDSLLQRKLKKVKEAIGQDNIHSAKAHGRPSHNDQKNNLYFEAIQHQHKISNLRRETRILSEMIKNLAQDNQSIALLKTSLEKIHEFYESFITKRNKIISKIKKDIDYQNKSFVHLGSTEIDRLKRDSLEKEIDHKNRFLNYFSKSTENTFQKLEVNLNNAAQKFELRGVWIDKCYKVTIQYLGIQSTNFQYAKPFQNEFTVVSSDIETKTTNRKTEKQVAKPSVKTNWQETVKSLSMLEDSLVEIKEQATHFKRVYGFNQEPEGKVVFCQKAQEILNKYQNELASLNTTIELLASELKKWDAKPWSVDEKQALAMQIETLLRDTHKKDVNINIEHINMMENLFCSERDKLKYQYFMLVQLKTWIEKRKIEIFNLTMDPQKLPKLTKTECETMPEGEHYKNLYQYMLEAAKRKEHAKLPYEFGPQVPSNTVNEELYLKLYSEQCEELEKAFKVRKQLETESSKLLESEKDLTKSSFIQRTTQLFQQRDQETVNYLQSFAENLKKRGWNVQAKGESSTSWGKKPLYVLPYKE